MTENEEFARIVTTDADAQTTGFFWCGGRSWEARDYRCVIVAKASGRKRPHLATTQLVGSTPDDLARAMARAELVPLPVEEIRALCESAARSPRAPSKRKAK